MNWEKKFSIGEKGMKPLGILPIPQNIWPKALKNFLAHAYKFIELVNELKC